MVDYTENVFILLMFFSLQHMKFLGRCSVCSAQAFYSKCLINPRKYCNEMIEEWQKKTVVLILHEHKIKDQLVWEQ